MAAKTLQDIGHVDCTKKNQLSLMEAKDQLKGLMLDSMKKMIVSPEPLHLSQELGIFKMIAALKIPLCFGIIFFQIL